MNFEPIEAWLELPADSVLEVWEGLVITLQLLCGLVLLALVLALPLALAATSGRAWPARLARGYSAAFRGTPLLVQLFFAYFVLPLLLPLSLPFLTVLLNDVVDLPISVLDSNALLSC